MQLLGLKSKHVSLELKSNLNMECNSHYPIWKGVEVANVLLYSDSWKTSMFWKPVNILQYINRIPTICKWKNNTLLLEASYRFWEYKTETKRNWAMSKVLISGSLQERHTLLSQPTSENTIYFIVLPIQWLHYLNESLTWKIYTECKVTTLNLHPYLC